MKKVVVGYIYCNKTLEKDEKEFLKEAKKKNVDVIFFNVAKDFNEDNFKKDLAKCDIIFNNSAENFAMELVKTFEELGKKVVDSSKAFYYNEDKWMFYIESEKHKIPVPKTILLSEDFNLAKQELLRFNNWPVVLKRIDRTMGEFVEMAHDIEEAKVVINNFWNKSGERVPIIAQEYIDSPSYRVMLINKKIVQTAVKKGNYWKKTGVYAKKVYKFKVDSDLKKLMNKLMDFVPINVCGVDLLKKDKKWLVLEVNSEPAFDFIDNERGKLMGKLIDFLKKEANIPHLVSK